jgi:hypothetical protein
VKSQRRSLVSVGKAETVETADDEQGSGVRDIGAGGRKAADSPIIVGAGQHWPSKMACAPLSAGISSQHQQTLPVQIEPWVRMSPGGLTL